MGRKLLGGTVKFAMRNTTGPTRPVLFLKQIRLFNETTINLAGRNVEVTGWI
jgi:hypothetical protein